MSHLTDPQLSALLDDALAAPERAACEAHLTGCEPCRARLAEHSALDASLAAALTHDPGEPYFASFAERVGARIAAEGTPAPSRAGQRSWWGWLRTPRGLSFAGGTAALVLTAGLAWMSLGQHDDVSRALRGDRTTPTGARVQEPEAPGRAPQPSTRPGAGGAPVASSEPEPESAPLVQRAAAPTAEPVNEPGPAARRDEPGKLRQSQDLRARDAIATRAGTATPAERPSAALDHSDVLENESRTAVEGAQLPQSTPSPAPVGTAPPTAETKQRAKEALGAVRSLLRESTTAPRAPVPGATAPQPTATWGALAKDEPRDGGGRARDLSLQSKEPREQVGTRCGAVRDRSGQPVAGAQVTVVGEHMSSVRSLSDGSFCLPASNPGDTLSVLHVGYAPFRMLLTPASSLTIALEPIGTLGPRSGLAMGGRPAPQLGAPPAFNGSSIAPRGDVFAAQPESVRVAVASARETATRARREHSVAGYEHAATLWQAIAAGLSLEPAYAARFQSLSALREAQRLEPSDERAARLRAGLMAFLAAVPRTLPERATALRWQSELSGPAAR